MVFLGYLKNNHVSCLRLIFACDLGTVLSPTTQYEHHRNPIQSLRLFHKKILQTLSFLTLSLLYFLLYCGLSHNIFLPWNILQTLYTIIHLLKHIDILVYFFNPCYELLDPLNNPKTFTYRLHVKCLVLYVNMYRTRAPE